MTYMARTVFWFLCFAHLSAAGCAWQHRGGNLVQIPCNLSTNPSAHELVQHLNANTDRLKAWRCTNMKISSKGPLGIPVGLSAMIAVERPRNFRLTAHSIAGNEVDLGSNDERLWFWIRRGEPEGLFTSRHDRLHVAQRRLPLPFQPEWIIEALGVIPLDESEVSLEFSQKNPTFAHLIRHRKSLEGKPVTMVTVVDSQRGLIVEHNLMRADGVLIARAKLSNHRQDPQTKAVLPHHVELQWPQASLGLTLELGEIEVLEAGVLAAQIFTMPKLPDYPVWDLGKETAQPAQFGDHRRPPHRTRQASLERDPVQESQPFEDPVEESQPVEEPVAFDESVPADEPLPTQEPLSEEEPSNERAQFSDDPHRSTGGPPVTHGEEEDPSIARDEIDAEEPPGRATVDVPESGAVEPDEPDSPQPSRELRTPSGRGIPGGTRGAEGTYSTGSGGPDAKETGRQQMGRRSRLWFGGAVK